MEKLNLLPKLTNNELDLLLTSIGCALQKCDQLDDKNSKQAEKELLNLYNNIQENTIEPYSYCKILADIKNDIEKDFSLWNRKENT